MKSALLVRWLLPVGLATATLIGTAEAQPRGPRPPRDRVVVNADPREAPPAPRAERPGPPRRGFVWVPGFYNWNNGRWEWNGGHWEKEREGKRWRPITWELRNGVYVRVDGDWIDDRPNAAPPEARNEDFRPRRGFVWIPGSWEWRNGQWDWSPGHFEKERRGHHWRRHRWEQRDGNWIHVDGGWEDGDDQGGVTVNVGGYPTVAPPALRDERPGTKAGFIWVRGRYEWRDGNYQWVDGHWERERANQRWIDGHWELRNGRYEWVEGSWGTGAPPPPPVAAYPTTAPPAPRDERPGSKAGFIWVRGRYEWRDGNYQWVDGHWERERANYRWADGRWELRNGRYEWVEGSWQQGGNGYVWADGKTYPWPENPPEGPPAMRGETPQYAPGKAWFPGRWIWYEGKYQWSPGHLVDGRPGYHLVPGTWDLRANGKWTYNNETWVADGPRNPPPPPVNNPPPPPVNNPPPPPPAGPTQPPPAPPAENPGSKSGFVWIRGHHEWRTNQYEWIPGHWERERAKQHWVDGRWELRGNVYVWIPGLWQ